MVGQPDHVTFDFATATRIVFGDGSLEQIGSLAGAFGRSALVVTGSRSLRAAGVLDRVADILGGEECACTTHAVDREPTVGTVDEATRAAREPRPDVIVAIGGGSALDAGKAVAGLATNSGSVLDYLEGVGTGRTLERDPLPFIAVPTTAGTGSEVTKNAVISGDDGGFKKSFRDNRLIADVALVDPELTHTMPPEVTAASGLDALTQLIESYTSNGASPVTGALALEGIRRASSSLARAFDDGSDREARSDMALASLLGGITLANAGLGAVHGLASPLGAAYPAPHGAACAILLPGIVSANIARARESGDEAVLAKYRSVADAMVGAPDVDALTGRLAELVARLRVPGLGSWGLEESGIPSVAAGASPASLRYNPVELTEDDLCEVLRAAL